MSTTPDRESLRTVTSPSWGKSRKDAALLLTLGEVSDLVSNSHDLFETLSNIVHHIQKRFGTDVCSVYTFERATDDLLLRATVGLRSESVNRVRMPRTEGLTGLVAEKKEPVAVTDASHHPRYRYFPESGEEEFKSFLGVPLIQGGEIQGVLVVQHREMRHHTANEIRMLAAVAAQLAILVANARLTREISEAVRRRDQGGQPQPVLPRSATLRGQAASPGFGRGQAIRYEEFDFGNPELVSRPPRTVDEEISRLSDALVQARTDIDRAAQHLAELLGDQFGAIMQAQRMMLEDFSVQRDVRRLIEQGKSVEQAIVAVCTDYLRAFAKLDNPFFYERIYDIKDVFRRVLSHACSTPSVVATQGAVVVVAHEVSLLELFCSDLSRVRGILVEKGGSFSHVAILARSLGIPMLTQVPRLLALVREGDEVYVDGGSNSAHLNPEPSLRKALDQIADAPEPSTTAVDRVDVPIRLETTVNLLPEITRTVKYGGEAVGLYRTEFLELAHRCFPPEEEQLEVYTNMVRLLNGRPLTVRTFDLRAEKLAWVASDSDQGSQSWEWRLVDKLPHVQDLVRTQLRAILRAGVDGPIRVLFPMITSQRQLDCALQLVAQAKSSLAEEGLPFCQDAPVGFMIEVPAAAVMAKGWAPMVDFVCVGSNDLLHSFLGIGRDDDQLLRLKTPLDPGYLKTVRNIVEYTHAAGRTVTICGEAASNPQAMLALFAIGVDVLCVPPDMLPRASAVFQSRRLPSDRDAVGHRLTEAADVEEVELILGELFPLKEDAAA